MSESGNSDSFVERILSGLGILIKLLVGLFVVLIVGGIPLIASAQWISGSTHNTYSYCQMKRMEAKISPADGEIYIDWCMESEGYRGSSECLTYTVRLPRCFYPRWQFWK